MVVSETHCDPTELTCHNDHDNKSDRGKASNRMDNFAKVTPAVQAGRPIENTM